MGGMNQAFQFQNPGGLNGLLSSPSFNAGLGILAAGNNQQAAMGALGGLQNAQAQQMQQAQAARQQKLNEELAKVFARQQQQRAQQAGSMQAQGMPQAMPPQQMQAPMQPPMAQPNLAGMPQGLQGLINPQQAPPSPLALPQAPRGQGTPVQAMAGGSGASAEEISRLMIQYGNPQQQQAALGQLSAAERYRAKVSREEQQLATGPDNVQSRQVLDDGRVITIRNSGKAELVKVDGEPVRAFNPAQFIKTADGSIYRADKTSGSIQPALPQAVAAENLAATDVTRQTAKTENASLLAAQDALPKVQESTDFLLKTINDVRNHPGLKRGIGSIQGHPLGIAVVDALGGTDFTSALEQLEGKAFLQAFETLKGGGTITEKEGMKASLAILRSNRRQSEPAFLKALDDFESYSRAILARKKRSAGVAVPLTKQELRDKYLK